MALAPRFHTVIAGPARKNDPQVIEAIMAAAVKPGSLVMLDSTGKLAVHNVAGGAGVALALQHNYIGGGDIRDAVPAGDTGAAIMCEDDGVKARPNLIVLRRTKMPAKCCWKTKVWFLPVTAHWPSRPLQQPTRSSSFHAKRSPLVLKPSS